MSISVQQSWQISPAEVTELELFLLRRMREQVGGEHASLHAGTGFNVVGLRDWEPGDSMSAIDWAQSSLSNFSPLITRQMEQDSAATVMIAADASLSTRCGSGATQLRSVILRCLAVLGLSAAFCQDRLGLVVFDELGRPLGTLRPRGGKAHAIQCLSLYTDCSSKGGEGRGDLLTQIESHLPASSLVVLVSDALITDIDALIDRLAVLTGEHDVLLVLVDARPAFAVPATNAGWIEIEDAETGELRTMSRASALDLVQQVDEWQREVMDYARFQGMDVVRVGTTRWEVEETLAACFAQRRLQKVRG